MRWQHPTLGLLPPGEFIPVAEHTGLIKPLTTWVLTTALSQCRKWLDETHTRGWPELSMAINVSTRSLLDDGFPDEVEAALDRWDIPAHLLELEITESAIMTDPLRARRLLTELAELGVRIAIDDFGTGYSSLAYLKDLPVNQLKIDQSFVQHLSLIHIWGTPGLRSTGPRTSRCRRADGSQRTAPLERCCTWVTTNPRPTSHHRQVGARCSAHPDSGRSRTSSTGNRRGRLASIHPPRVCPVSYTHLGDRKSTRLNSSHPSRSRMPSSA